jgi:hypothetical protein
MSLDRQIAYVGMFTIGKFNISSRTVGLPFVGSTAIRGSADGTGTSATFNSISNVALWMDETYLVVADNGNCNLRLVNLANHIVTTLAGLAGTCGFADGVGLAAQFKAMTDIVINPDTDVAYVADPANFRIRAVFLTNQTVITIAGNGVYGDANGIGTAATISPVYLTLSGNSALYVKTYYGIRKVDLNTLAVTTLTTTLSQSPMQMALSSSGLNIYYGAYHKVSRFFIPLKTSTDIAGLTNTFGFVDGQGAAARFRNPQAVILLDESITPNSICLQCTSCDAGYYGLCTVNSSDCYPCPANQFSNAGSSACSFCSPGKYASNGLCINCGVGTFALTGATDAPRAEPETTH